MAQNFLPQQVSTLTPDALDLSRVQRRQALADALLQESMTPINPNRMSGRFMSAVSPLEGIAKLVQAGVGAYQQRKAEEGYKDIAGKRVNRVRDSLAARLDAMQPKPEEVDPRLAPYDEAALDAPSTPFPGAESFDRSKMGPKLDFAEALRGESIKTPQVRVRGDAPGMTPQQTAEQRRLEMLISALDSGMDPQQVTALDFQHQMQQFQPVKLGEGEMLAVPGQKPIMENPKYRAPQFVESGAGFDAKGRPLEKKMRFDPVTGMAVDIPGVTPVTKGPLATATASVSQKDPFKAERDLRGDFKSEPVYKAHQEIRSAYSQIQGALKQGTAIADVAAATKVMKLLDPGSVVRESELGIAMASTGLMDRVLNYANQIATGQRLTPQQRKEFGKLADEFFMFSQQHFDQAAEEARRYASDYGLNPDRVAPPRGGVKPKAPAGQKGGNSDGFEVLR
jgi:hypothetical protein